MRSSFLLLNSRFKLALIAWAVLSAALSLVPTSATATGTGATVSGHVSLAPSGQPADGGHFLVYYTCDSPEVTGGTCESTSRATSVLVDDSGNFSITGIQDAGHYTFYVVATFGEYVTAERDVDISDPNGDYTGVDVTLQPLAVISGHVALGTDDVAAGAGSVRVWAVQYPDATSSGYAGTGSLPVFTTTVQADGDYQIGVTPDYYRIEFLPVGSSVYPNAWWTDGGPPVDSSRHAVPISIGPDATVIANMTIPVGGTISGSLANVPFSSKAGIDVYDASDGRNEPGYGYEYQFGEGDGAFNLGPLLPGSYHVIADASTVQPVLVGESSDAYQPRDFDVSAGETVSGATIQLGQITQVQPALNCLDCGAVNPYDFVHVQWNNPSTGQWENVPANPTTSHDAWSVDGGASDLIAGTYRIWSMSPWGGITRGLPFSVSNGSELSVPFSFDIFPSGVEVSGELSDSGLREDVLGPGSSAIAWLSLQPNATADSGTSTLTESSSPARSDDVSAAETLFPRPWYLDPLG